MKYVFHLKRNIIDSSEKMSKSNHLGFSHISGQFSNVKDDNWNLYPPPSTRGGAARYVELYMQTCLFMYCTDTTHVCMWLDWFKIRLRQLSSMKFASKAAPPASKRSRKVPQDSLSILWTVCVIASRFPAPQWRQPQEGVLLFHASLSCINYWQSGG